LKLSIVGKRAPSRREAALLRPKEMDAPEGTMTCPRCGSHSSLNVYSNRVMNPETKKVSRGTVLYRDICAVCFGDNLVIAMSPHRRS
jgi:hypothetical protein